MAAIDQWSQLINHIKQWSQELGFADVGVSDINLANQRQAYEHWIEQNYHGEMLWLNENSNKRLDPGTLVADTSRVICVRLNYLPENTEQIQVLKTPNKAYISRYALGRDYHKLIRKRLAKLGAKIDAYALANGLHSAPYSRAFVDSAPVLERPLAEKSGLGWTGKHTLILNRHEGSWFFLGELFTNLPLPINQLQEKNECGDCQACMQICPTDAFPEPYVLDARRCISYLTIEYKGVIPLEFREPMGNRIFGCDDCQVICPWNKFAKHTEETDFSPRHQLQNEDILTLFTWSETTFLKNTEGSAIRRSGFQNWQRNLAIALGNAPQDIRIMAALEGALTGANTLLAEHIHWALEQQKKNKRRKRKIKNPNRIHATSTLP